jgi:tetratricopeptide (TPR) repeat protein
MTHGLHHLLRMREHVSSQTMRTDAYEGSRDACIEVVIHLLAVLLLVGPAGPSLYAEPSYSPNLERAQTFVERGQYREALPFLRASIEQKRPPEALYLRGHVYLQLNRPSKAMTDAKTLKRVFPSDWRGHYLQARVYLHRSPTSGKRAKLIKALRNTLQRKPDHEQARMHLGEVFARSGRLEQALDAFRRAEKALSDHPETARTAARVAFLQGKSDLALKWSDTVFRLLPHDPVAARIRSFARNNVSTNVERRIWKLQKERETKLSEPSLRTLQDQHSNIVHVLLFCGRRYLERGKVDQARTLARKAEKIRGDAWTAFFRAQVFEANKQYDRAAEWFETSTRRRSPFPEADLRAGICHSRAGRHEQAIKVLRSVLDRVRVDREAGERLLRSCLKTGHIVFARRHLSQLNLSDEQEKTFKQKLESKLSRRREREKESFSDGVYRNDLYGMKLNLADGWSHALDAGRTEVLALFVHLKHKGRLFLVAERRLPSLQADLNKKRVRSAVRSYVISNVLREQAGLQFVRQQEFTEFDRPAMKFVFREPERGRSMHAVVTVNGPWMITLYLYRRSGTTPDSDAWMKDVFRGAIIQDR